MELNNIIDLSLKRGLIYIGNIYNWDSIEADMFGFCSTNSDDLPPGSFPIKELAPSFQLSLQIGVWIENNSLDLNKAKSLYINELNSNIEKINALKKIEEFVRNGRTIVLFDTFYPGSKFSHLYFLGELLHEQGFRVKYLK